MGTTLYLVSAEATTKELGKRLQQARLKGITYVLHPDDSLDDGIAARYLALWPLIREGCGYWKVGITHHADPLRRNPAAYREVFRAVVFDSEDEAREVELQIARWFGELIPSVHGREAAHYSTDLSRVLEIFDACVDGREPQVEAGVSVEAPRSRELAPMW